MTPTEQIAQLTARLNMVNGAILDMMESLPAKERQALNRAAAHYRGQVGAVAPQFVALTMRADVWAKFLETVGRANA